MSESLLTLMPSYQPQPIRKSRVHPFKTQPIINRPSASIAIQMQAFEKVSRQQTEEQVEAMQKLADFVPLSTTPAPYTTQENFDARNFVRSE